MKFLSIELAGYTRISLSGINYIKLTFTEVIQLILGTNGSGKSSLLNELTPLPSNGSNYLKEGFSIKTITHNGSLFVLKSTFSPSQKHSFIKDEVELNLGGTVTVQKELVKQEFGITPEIHELLSGRDKFTRMSPSQRRYWFTQLSSVSYDYAIGVYNKLRERLRDTSGALKINKSRLVNETSKLIPVEEQVILNEEVATLYEFLSLTTDVRLPVESTVEVINNKLIESNSESLKIGRALIKHINKIKINKIYGDDETVKDLINDLQSRQRVMLLLLEDLHGKLKKHQHSLTILQKTGSQGVDELNAKITSLRQEQLGTQLNKTTLTESINPNALETLRAFESVQSGLVSVFNEIPSNGDLRYSTGAKNKCLETITRYEQKIDYLKSEISRLNGRKKHLEDHKNIEGVICPKCNTPFGFGFSSEDYDKIINLIEAHSVDYTSTLKLKEQEQETIEEINNYFRIYSRYKTIVETYPILNSLWDLIDRSIVSQPSICITYLDKFKSDTILDKNYSDLELEINSIHKLLIAKKELGDQDINKIRLEAEEIEIEIYNKQSEQSQVNIELQNIIQYKNDLTKAVDLENRLNTLSKELDTLFNDKVETLRRQTVIDGIRFVQSILSKKENQLSELKTQEVVIAKLQENITSLEEDERCLKLIVNELSPTDGLIAEGLFGFIRLFVGQMNSFIKKIWTYDMEIMSCELSEDSKVELDYKFPILVEDRPKPVPDVSNGSTGMMEIIDLAFKIVATKHLKLSDTPLFLDEFGSTLDHTHRTLIYGIFDYLVNQIQFSQVFLVNHYSDLYGSLKNAEVCILHDTNIEIPKGSIYNKHVLIA